MNDPSKRRVPEAKRPAVIKSDFRGQPYVPIKLKGILVRAGIAHPELSSKIAQSSGAPLSRVSLNQILNHSYFPKNTPMDDVKRQIVEELRRRGIPDGELATCWEPEDGDIYRYRPPVGSHDPGRARTQPEPDFDYLEISMLSPQAKRHFKIFRDPFGDDVSGPDDVYQSDAQRYVVEAMMQTALLGGITAVIGESGSGKTTLRKLLVNRIAREGRNIRLIFPQILDKSRLSTGAICTAIVKDLEPDSSVRSGLEGQARQVKDVLLRSARAGFKSVLLIEEAHDLNIQTLKYLKRFYEIETDDGFGKALSIILIAQPELRTKLDSSRYPEAREFINRCEVATLDALGKDLGDYLRHKLVRVNVAPDSVFDEGAVDAIRARWTKVDNATRAVKTNLYPLIVNNTLVRAMNRAAELGLPMVTADLIKEL